MKALKQAAYAFVATVLLATNYNCSSPKQIAFQAQPEFQNEQAVFQEWYAGIDVGGTGYNIFLPGLADNDKIKFETIYFRNLKGSLVETKGMYSAVVKNPSPYYTWEYPEKPVDYPFDLAPDECVIAYTENGETKYFKIANLSERAGTYYENGHPSLLAGNSTTTMATVDED